MSTPEQLLLAPGHREQSLAWAAGGAEHSANARAFGDPSLAPSADLGV